MSKYNKIYFLHIPKTGGRFFTKYILEPNESVLKQNGIDILKLPENVDTHGGWHKDIDENTYVISVFRDPAEFFVSLVAHMVADQNGLIDEDKDYIIKDKSLIIDIDKQFLFDQIDQLKYLNNFQSQNFTLTPEKNQLVTESRRSYNNGINLDTKLVNERVNRVDLMIRHKDLKNMNYSELTNKISNDLGIDIKIQITKENRDHYKNISSEILFNKLSKDEIELIYQNFLFDKEIYDNDSLFWTGR
jgi:hypothetical protein